MTDPYERQIALENLCAWVFFGITMALMVLAFLLAPGVWWLIGSLFILRLFNDRWDYVIARRKRAWQAAAAAASSASGSNSGVANMPAIDCPANGAASDGPQRRIDIAQSAPQRRITSDHLHTPLDILQITRGQ